MTDLERVLAWADAEYKRRTEAIESGTSTNIDWLEPSSRVCVTEIMAYARRQGLTVDRMDLELALVKRAGRKYT